ncbi:hypothetical protein D9M68_797210 [compost metagenome]
MFLADGSLDLLPFHAERWVGEHVVEALAGMAVVAEGVSGFDIGYFLALDQHVRLADSVGLVVQLLAMQV